MKKFIGDRKFYKILLVVMIPIVLQQLLTQFVGLLDNIMIGQVGNSEMTGVSLSNQILFIFNLSIFGSLSGASIFATQFFGANNKSKYQETFRFKWLMGLSIFAIFTIVIIIFKEQIINLFINNIDGEYTNPQIVLSSGKTYLMIMLIGNFFFTIKEIYATSLREQKETLFPMICGIIAIVINLCLNYILIFGHLGFPALGVNGAAIATVISRGVEAVIIIIYASLKRQKFPFFIGVYRQPIVKLSSFKQFFPKTILLLSNEFFWSLGLTVIVSCYSLRGLDAISSLNIGNVVNNLFITMGTALGNATSIILGNLLGSNKVKEAKDASYRILAFCIFATVIVSLIMVASAYIVPNIYVTSDDIKNVAQKLILVGALFLPFHAFNTCCYFTLRSGGKVLLTIAFDSLFIWLVRLPLAFLLVKFTDLSFIWIYFIVDGSDLLKTVLGYYLVDKGIWLKVIA